MESADRWFERWGSWAVFVTRMLPGVRSIISLPAGIARMPVLRFSFFTTLGSIPWNLALAYLGYLFGANWEQLRELLPPVRPGLLRADRRHLPGRDRLGVVALAARADHGVACCPFTQSGSPRSCAVPPGAAS